MKIIRLLKHQMSKAEYNKQIDNLFRHLIEVQIKTINLKIWFQEDKSMN